MTSTDAYLVPPLAHYAAGIALADWLSGNTPKAIYSLSRFPETSGQKIANRAKRLWAIGTNFKRVVMDVDPTRPQLRDARCIALNQACVVLGGLAATALLTKLHKAALNSLFHLAVSDFDRAAKLLEPVTSSPDMAWFIANQIEEGMAKFYRQPELARLIGDLATMVLKCGEMNQELLTQFFEGSEQYRVTPPKPLIEWPSTKPNYIVLAATNPDSQEKRLSTV